MDVNNEYVVADQILRLDNTKQNIKQAIIQIGGDVTDVPFEQYHEQIVAQDVTPEVDNLETKIQQLSDSVADASDPDSDITYQGEYVITENQTLSTRNKLLKEDLQIQVPTGEPVEGIVVPINKTVVASDIQDFGNFKGVEVASAELALSVAPTSYALASAGIVQNKNNTYLYGGASVNFSLGNELGSLSGVPITSSIKKINYSTSTMSEVGMFSIQYLISSVEEGITKFKVLVNLLMPSADIADEDIIDAIIKGNIVVVL